MYVNKLVIVFYPYFLATGKFAILFPKYWNMFREQNIWIITEIGSQQTQIQMCVDFVVIVMMKRISSPESLCFTKLDR